MGTSGQSELLNQVTPKFMYYIQRDEYKIMNHRRIQHKFHYSGLYPERLFQISVVMLNVLMEDFCEI
jgi:hypothetical protein